MLLKRRFFSGRFTVPHGVPFGSGSIKVNVAGPNDGPRLIMPRCVDSSQGSLDRGEQPVPRAGRAAPHEVREHHAHCVRRNGVRSSDVPIVRC
jgi:hypothetical protein